MDQPARIPPAHRPAAQPERVGYPENRRLARMRKVSRLLDTAFLLPGGFRLGLDPILGLVPGLGDVVASLLSAWIVYDAARLGISKRILLRMVLNIALDTVVGAVPVIGDILDVAWKANTRNLRLVEAHFNPAARERSAVKLIAAALLVVLVGGLSSFLLLRWVIEAGLIRPIENLFQHLF